MNKQEILSITFIAISTIIGYLVGKYQERKDWNQLIEEGKINKSTAKTK